MKTTVLMLLILTAPMVTKAATLIEYGELAAILGVAAIAVFEQLHDGLKEERARKGRKKLGVRSSSDAGKKHYLYLYLLFSLFWAIGTPDLVLVMFSLGFKAERVLP